MCRVIILILLGMTLRRSGWAFRDQPGSYRRSAVFGLRMYLWHCTQLSVICT